MSETLVEGGDFDTGDLEDITLVVIDPERDKQVPVQK